MNRDEFIDSYVLSEAQFPHIVAEGNYASFKDGAMGYVASVCLFLRLSNQQIPDYLSDNNDYKCIQEMAHNLESVKARFINGSDY